MLVPILVFIVVVVLATAAYGGHSAAIWVPMSGGDAERAVAFAGVTDGDIIYDLGAGDGRVDAAAAVRGARATGFEVSLVPYILSLIRRMRSPHRARMQMRYANFWKQDISDATVVCIYLMPGMYQKILDKITNECAPGTTIVTYVWPLPDRTEDDMSELQNHPKIWKYTL